MKYGSLGFNSLYHTLQGNHKSLVLIVLQNAKNNRTSKKQQTKKWKGQFHILAIQILPFSCAMQKETLF